MGLIICTPRRYTGTMMASGVRDYTAIYVPDACNYCTLFLFAKLSFISGAQYTPACTLRNVCDSQYHKSNSALDLMIGELRLKVDGMQKELHTQNKRLEEGARFAEHFHNDLRAAVQVLQCSCSSRLLLLWASPRHKARMILTAEVRYRASLCICN